MGVQLRKLMRSRVIVVFGATSRFGRATIETLTSNAQFGATVVAAVENPKDPRSKQLKQYPGCYVVRCDFSNIASIQRVMRHADSVLLIPALSDSGTRFSKRVIDAVGSEDVSRLVIISSILASDDGWRQNTTPSTASMGYEAVEAHARSVSKTSCIALRIPMLMESCFYCREDILFANRFFGCVDRDTQVPCIAVNDVAFAAARVLTMLDRKFNPTYSLTHADSTCSPQDMEELLTQSLGRVISYRQVSEARLTEILKDKNASDQVATNLIRMKMFLERTDQTSAPLVPLFTNDYRHLTEKSLVSPRQWLHQNLHRFVRTQQNQMQLYVIGSGEGLFQEVERFVAQQVTNPLDVSPSNAGEAAIPTARGGASHSKATFCAIKSMPGSRTGPVINVPGQHGSPMTNLLDQLSSLDVIVYIPPLRLGPTECMQVTQALVDAAKKANVWGIVVVSSLFIGQGWDDHLNRMSELEQYIANSGVPFAVLRFPLFMEYFLVLSMEDETLAPHDVVMSEEEKQPEGQRMQQQPLSADETWYLTDRSLASSPQYLISTTDAAKVLVAVAFTFPLHRNKTRMVYTECLTMHEIEDTLNQYSYHSIPIDFSRINALKESSGHEFWRVSYWTKDHLKQFLESSVRLSGQAKRLEMKESFEEITECEPITLDKWARRNAKAYTQRLGLSTRDSS